MTEWMRGIGAGYKWGTLKRRLWWWDDMPRISADVEFCAVFHGFARAAAIGNITYPSGSPCRA